jgi:membrane protein YqaA with SNARE-associated domain
LFRHLTDLLISWGPAGILLLSVLDSSGVPVAGVFDALLILIAVKTPSVAWLCAGLAVLGSTIGNVMLFWTARKGGARFITNAPQDGRSARFREWFLRYGMLTVFIPALVPIPMPLKFFVISAGVMGTAPWEFIGVVLLARILRYFGEAWLGIRLGEGAGVFLKTNAGYLTGSAVLLFLILYTLIRWSKRERVGR